MIATSKFAFILDHLDAMTPEESRQSLIRAGIITQDGELAPKYQPKPKAKKKKKPVAA